MGGGTDGWSAFLAGEGVAAGGINIPSRYIHTAVSTVKMEDLEHTVYFMYRYVTDK
jgi:endoglucanase